MKKAKICVYAICKNEELFIERWITPLLEADYIVVVDTGSTDRSVELLKNYDKVILKQANINPWRFDTARNIALSWVPEDTDICVMSDIDFVFKSGWSDILRERFNEGFEEINGVIYDSNGDIPKFKSKLVHPNDGNWHWERPVHEWLVYTGTHQLKQIYDERFVVYHEPDLSKGRDYLKILRDEYEKNKSQLNSLYYANALTKDESTINQAISIYNEMINTEFEQVDLDTSLQTYMNLAYCYMITTNIEKAVDILVTAYGKKEIPKSRKFFHSLLTYIILTKNPVHYADIVYEFIFEVFTIDRDRNSWVESANLYEDGMISCFLRYLDILNESEYMAMKNNFYYLIFFNSLYRRSDKFQIKEIPDFLKNLDLYSSVPISAKDNTLNDEFIKNTLPNIGFILGSEEIEEVIGDKYVKLDKSSIKYLYDYFYKYFQTNCYKYSKSADEYIKLLLACMFILKFGYLLGYDIKYVNDVMYKLLNKTYNGRKIQMDNKICVYAICKNEAQFVDKWVESMKEADSIVVLDTGSTDNTVEELKKYPFVKVEQAIINPWRFDVARNEALKLAPEDCNILISTDLDELLEPGWAQPLRDKWIEGVHERGEYYYAWSHLENGEPGRVFHYNKIHSRNWIWKYPVHELLYNEQTKTNDYPYESSLNLWDDVKLHHYPDQTKSRGSYLGLLELRAEEDPDDYYGLIYLAHEYYYRGFNKESISTLEKILNNFSDRLTTVERASCFLFMGDAYKKLENFKESIQSYFTAISVDNTYREPYLNLAKVYIHIKEYDSAIYFIKEGLKKSYRHYTWLERDISWTYEPWDLLSLAEFYAGYKTESLAHAYKAYSYNENDDRLKSNIDIILKMSNDVELI